MAHTSTRMRVNENILMSSAWCWCKIIANCRQNQEFYSSHELRRALKMHRYAMGPKSMMWLLNAVHSMQPNTKHFWHLMRLHCICIPPNAILVRENGMWWHLHTLRMLNMCSENAQFIVDLLCATTRIRNQFIFVVTIWIYMCAAFFLLLLLNNFSLFLSRFMDSFSLAVFYFQPEFFIVVCMFVARGYVYLNVIVLHCFFFGPDLRVSSDVCCWVCVRV